MKLSDVIVFVKKNKDLLDELKGTAGETLDAARADEIQNAFDRAEAFLNELASVGGVQVEIDDTAQRTGVLDAGIARLEAERDATSDLNEKMALGLQLASLQQQRAAVATAGAFYGIVVIPDLDREDLRKLLVAAQDDIAERASTAAGIRITTKLVTLSARLGVKLASAGIV